MRRSSFAYLFERFPSFVQTFVYREAAEMERQGMQPRLISIRRPEETADLAAPFDLEVLYLPEADELRAEINRLHESRKLPATVRRAITNARQETDSNRVFEAAWLGPRLRREHITHVHAHFAGMAARTAWRLRQLYRLTYSFTGHANDIFCETEYPVSNEDLVREAKFVVTETEFAREWMAKKYPRAAGKVFPVYNGIDDDFPPRRPREGTPRILSVGRLVEKKGFDDLVEACRQLRPFPVECDIVGDGPLKDTLQAQIDAALLTNTVRLLGARSQREVRELLAASHLFVLPCVPEAHGGSDNLPTAIMEAMMAGMPIVSTRIAGIPEMIQHGENGLLVAPRSPTDLAAGIKQLLADNALAERLGSRARATAMEKFSIATSARTLKHLLVCNAGVKPPRRALELDPTLPRSLFRRWFG